MCLFLLFDVCFRKNCSTLPIYYSFLYGEKDVVLHRDLIVTLNDTIMKRFGLFLLKNNIHLMTLVFLGWAVWAACNWQELVLVQKLVMGMYAWLIVHEYEEGYKGKFLALFSRVLGRDISQGTPGASHLAQAVYITVLFTLPLLFPNQLWLAFPVFILGIFEGFVHTMGIFVFKLGKPSPGWYTAAGMCAFSIWSLVVLNRNVEYDGIQWLWAMLYYVAMFACLELWFQHLIGSSLPYFASKMRAYIKQAFDNK